MTTSRQVQKCRLSLKTRQMADSKQDLVTLTFRLPEERKNQLMSRLASKGVKLQWLMEQCVAGYLDTDTIPNLGQPSATPVPSANAKTHGQAPPSPNPSQLRELRDSLTEAVAMLDGVLDGQTIADRIGKVERAIATGEDFGGSGPDSSSDRLKKPKAR
jgi:hypothetical protein